MHDAHHLEGRIYWSEAIRHSYISMGGVMLLACVFAITLHLRGVMSDGVCGSEVCLIIFSACSLLTH